MGKCAGDGEAKEGNWDRQFMHKETLSGKRNKWATQPAGVPHSLLRLSLDSSKDLKGKVETGVLTHMENIRKNDGSYQLQLGDLLLII